MLSPVKPLKQHVGPKHTVAVYSRGKTGMDITASGHLTVHSLGGRFGLTARRIKHTAQGALIGVLIGALGTAFGPRLLQKGHFFQKLSARHTAAVQSKQIVGQSKAMQTTAGASNEALKKK